jgi:hypothetical protein
MAAPPIVERHKHHFHRQSPIKETVRVATTADITIATALNAGDTLDGVTLVAGDRVLVKDQGTGSQNGIYVAGASPARDYDVSTDDPDIRGSLIYVRDGTANGGKLFRSTNLTLPTIGTTSLVFAEFTAASAFSLTVEEGDGAPTVSDVDTIVFDETDFTVTDDGGGQVTITTIGGGGSTVDIEDEGAAEGAADTIDFTGAGVSVTFAAGTATVDIPGGGGGGGDAEFYLDTYSLPRDGTYGDDFDGASLNARWTRKNIVSGQETYQDANGSWMRVNMVGTATAAQQYQQNLPGSGDWDFICSMTCYVQAASATMYGLVAYDNSGNGLGPVAYVGDHNTYLGIITGFTYNSNGGGIAISIMPNGKKLWYRLKKVSTTYTAYISLDGFTWSRGPTRTDATAFTKIAFGRIFGGSTDEEFVVDMFDRVS